MKGVSSANTKGGTSTKNDVQNLFSQDKEFPTLKSDSGVEREKIFAVQNKPAPANQNKNQPNSSHAVKNEETQQFNTFLNILGFQIQNNSGAPPGQEIGAVSENHPKSSDLLMRTKTGVYLVKATSKTLNDPEIVFVCKESNYAAFTKEGDFIIVKITNKKIYF